MDQKTQPAAARVYEDYEPSFDWARDEGSDTLILMLPGFKKEQLRVQTTSTRILRLTGERQISENKWLRFRKQFVIPPDSDTNGVSARFEVGNLYVRLPKVITPIKPQAATTPPQEAAQQPTTEAPNAQAADQQKPREDKAAEAETENEKTEAPAPTHMAPLLEPETDEDSRKKPQKEKDKAETDDNKVAKERAEATTSKAEEMHETPDGLGKGEAKMDKRSPTLDLLARQTQDYKNAFSGFVGELKKQKKLANLLVVIFFVLVLGLYLKNAIKSSFGGSKNQEL